MYILKDWSVCFKPHYIIFTEEDEPMPGCLGGKVYGREPRFPDGKEVITSRIVDVEGRKITTRSGSVYLLEGPPSEDYMVFLKKNGLEYDEDFPIKMVELDIRKLN